MKRWLSGRARRLTTVVALASAAISAGCENVTDPLLDFQDPDIISPADIASSDGAEALRVGALGRLTNLATGAEGTFLLGGMLADEWRSGDTFQQRNETDQRNIDSTNSFMTTAFRDVSRARVAALLAIDYLRLYRPAPRDYQGQMFFVVGFAMNQAAESFCSGIPFSSGASGTLVFGDPLTTDQAFEQAAAAFDSAAANAPDSARFRFAAAVGKGRALMNRNLYTEAAAAVAGVPFAFQYRVLHSLTATSNQNWALNNNIKRYVVAERQGGNGLPFISANDPRLPTLAGGNDFEGKPGFVAQLKYGQESPTVIASGIEAKLIIAEALLRSSPTTTQWLDTLNFIRANAGVAGLKPLMDPGTPAARVDSLFRERAFWMFGTGHRLGDMRRLIRQYRRGPETVFPTGIFIKGGNFGTDVTLPIPAAERNNPKYTVACKKNEA